MNTEESVATNSPAVPDPATPADDPINPGFSEDRALSLLQDPSLTTADIEQFIQDAALLKSRKVRLALAAHARTPRRIALRLIRELYTFDLMQFSQHIAAAADLKRRADELLVSRLASVTLGERIALARRSSTMVAAALLLDKESRVWQTTLENPRLTEAAVAKALQRPQATHGFVEAVSHHTKWSLRSEIRMALLRNPHTPLARALEFARRIPPPLLRDILHASRLPEKIKEYLRKELRERK